MRSRRSVCLCTIRLRMNTICFLVCIGMAILHFFFCRPGVAQSTPNFGRNMHIVSPGSPGYPPVRMESGELG